MTVLPATIRLRSTSSMVQPFRPGSPGSRTPLPLRSSNFWPLIAVGPSTEIMTTAEAVLPLTSLMV